MNSTCPPPLVPPISSALTVVPILPQSPPLHPDLLERFFADRQLSLCPSSQTYERMVHAPRWSAHPCNPRRISHRSLAETPKSPASVFFLPLYPNGPRARSLRDHLRPPTLMGAHALHLRSLPRNRRLAPLGRLPTVTHGRKAAPRLQT